MSKAPAEVLKEIECCWETRWKEGCAVCNDCPYLGVRIPVCKEALERDTLVLIQQLESDKQQLEGMLTHMNQLRDAAAGRALKMEERARQLEAERDAAVAGLKKAANEKGECFECKWYNGKNCTHQDYKTLCSSHDDKWEWRGVTKEE